MTADPGDPGDPRDSGDTRGERYAERLAASVTPRRGWRKLLDPQRPYRWNIRRLKAGRVLDIGCGAGRNLAHLDGDGVGVDHNPTSVAIARSLGLTAYSTDEFDRSADAVAGAYDTLLVAHVLEHMTSSEATALIERYLPYLAADGNVVAICPQRRGQRSDPTHVTYMPRAVIASVFADAGLEVRQSKSFPFPEFVGRVFAHNETVVVARRMPGAR